MWKVGPFIPYALLLLFFYKHRKVSPLYLHKEHRDMIQVQCEWIVSLCRTARRVRVIEDLRTRVHTPQINGRHGREKGVASVAMVTGGQRCWILLPGRRGSLPPSERRQTGVVRPGR